MVAWSAQNLSCYGLVRTGWTVKSSSPSNFMHNLRQAWTALRSTQPPIACTLSLDAQDQYELMYRTPSGVGDVQDWLRQTFIANEPCNQAKLWDEMRSKRRYFQKNGNFVMALHVAQDPQVKHSFSIWLTGSHAHADGHGYLIIARTLMELLVSGSEATEWGNEIERLTLPISYVLGLKNDNSETPKELSDVLKSMADHAMDCGPQVCLPVNTKTLCINEPALTMSLEGSHKRHHLLYLQLSSRPQA